MIIIQENRGSLRYLQNSRDSSYFLEILKAHEIKDKKAQSWLKEQIKKEVKNKNSYYILFNTDAFDVYVFLPFAQEIIGDIELKHVSIRQVESTLLIYIDSEEQIAHKKESSNLILHFYSNNEEAKEVIDNCILIINGFTFASLETSYTN